jgi:hypothetical protein
MARRVAEDAANEPTQSYSDAIAAIAAGVTTLTAAGMGASCAGDLALKVWCAANGVACPADQPPAE